METDSAKEVKTYSRISRISEVDWMPKLNLSDTLSSREALQFLLNGTLRLRVCRYCLNITNNLCELDEVLVLAGKSGLYEVTIKDIIGSFHPIKVIYDENYPNKICTSCFENALQCYLFTQRCEQAERAFNNFFEDINEKFNKLDPMEPVKKRGKPKLKPNHNILYTEHRNVIDYAEPIINLIHLNTLSTNNDSNNLECPKCWQVLPNQMSLVNHEKAHPQTMWYHCKECGKAFVKYTQLKRHMRLGHEDIQNTECYMFTCKQCGCRNHSLNEHLLHIEKHRFTSALKDLVMKPEGNCDICFNKDVTVNLNESMHFQGMGKGLVGEKTIHTIASTIFPDRSYKYQELLIPLQAPILCPLKRKKEVFIGLNKKIKNTTEQRLRKINKENRHFVFSVPEKVHLLTYENVRNSIYEKEPNANNYFVNISITPHQPKNTEIGTEIMSLNNSNQISPNQIDQIDNVHETQRALINTKEKILKENAFANCNICWIFKKPTCSTCKYLEDCVYNKKSNTINTESYNAISGKTSKKCNSCYIFSKMGYCGLCKKELSTDNNDVITCSIGARKQKEIKSTETDIWQCKICLTNNIKRATCICCEENRFLTSNIKVSFKNGNTFLCSKTSDECSPSAPITITCIENLSLLNNILYKNKCDSSTTLIIDEKCQKKSESLPKIDDNINKNTGYHVNNGSQNLSPDKTSKELPIFNPGNAYLNQEETLMDTETQSNVEVMDFEEGNNIPEKRNITQNSTVDYIPTHAQIGITPNAEWQAPINNRMMFSIGTAQAERKRKKPTRRSSTFIK